VAWGSRQCRIAERRAQALAGPFDEISRRLITRGRVREFS